MFLCSYVFKRNREYLLFLCSSVFFTAQYAMTHVLMFFCLKLGIDYIPFRVQCCPVTQILSPIGCKYQTFLLSLRPKGYNSKYDDTEHNIIIRKGDAPQAQHDAG